MNTRIFSITLFCVGLASLPASATVRPDIAKDLKRAVAFARDSHFPLAEQQIKVVEETPYLTNEEKQALAKTKAVIAAGVHNIGVDCNICDMAPSGVPDFGPAGMPVTDAPPR